MDGCLELKPVKIPRPQIYSFVDLAILNSKKEREIKMKDLKNKYKALPVEIVAIYKTKPTLGIAIQGGFDTNIKHPTVVHIQPGGSAFASGLIKCGHRILEINGQSTISLTHEQTANLIAKEFISASNTHSMELVVTSSNTEEPC